MSTTLERTIPEFGYAAPNQFKPNPEDLAIYGTYKLTKPVLLTKPNDVSEAEVVYNPSGTWTITGKDGVQHNVAFVRKEQSQSSPSSSHIGKTTCRPYVIDLDHPGAELRPYDDGDEMMGEDPSLTRINIRLPISGKIEKNWLLGVVVPRPKKAGSNEVAALNTQFYVGTTLKNLTHIADGPPWMKDIRISQSDDTSGTELDVYGRPQTEPFSGNITYTTVKGIEKVTPDVIANAPYIDEDLLPIGSGFWGGVGGVYRVAKNRRILATHRAWCTGEDSSGRHYESVLFGHNIETSRIVELGVLATADMFPEGTVKDDASVDLKDVSFTGGGHNGKLDRMYFGISDGNVASALINRTK